MKQFAWKPMTPVVKKFVAAVAIARKWYERTVPGLDFRDDQKKKSKALVKMAWEAKRTLESQKRDIEHDLADLDLLLEGRTESQFDIPFISFWITGVQIKRK